MYNVPYMFLYQHPYYVNAPTYNYGPSVYWDYSNELGHANRIGSFSSTNEDERIALKDYGPEPLVIDIDEATQQNEAYRIALWTGSHLQVTLMSLNVGEDIGLEMHPNVDQFLRIEKGQGTVQMGQSKDNLSIRRNVDDDSAIIVPAGTWHNLTNTGSVPLRLYSIYAPPNHPFGTIHTTKADAEAAEDGVGH